MGPKGGATTPLKQKELGNQLYSEGKYVQAIEAYERGIALCHGASPECVTLHSNAAMCHLQDRNYERCISHCSLALEMDPNHVKSLLRRGLAYEGLEKLSSALADFRQLQQIDPTVTKAMEGISRVQRAMRLKEKTLNAERAGVDPRSARREPGMTTSERAAKVLEYKNMGNSFFGRGVNDEAIKMYSKAIELDDRGHVLFSNRSAAYYNAGYFDKAADDAERVVELMPNWPKGHYRKGVAHLALKNYMQAASAFAAALELDPRNDAILQGLKEARSHI